MNLRVEYDGWHERLVRAAPDHDDASSPWYQLVREYIGPVAGVLVLEVACGRGGFVKELARSGARVSGCDFSFSALCAASTKLRDVSGRATLIQGDAQCLPFADATFDLLVSCETIEHVPNLRSAMAEMHRVTRPGGRLLLTTPNYANFMGLYELYARFRHSSRAPDQPFDRHEWFAETREHVRSAGWRILRTDGTVHQFPVVRGRPPLRLEAIESSRTMRKLFSPLAFHYFIMAQKEGST
jgi:SAM-dependent methyltransferase